VENLTMDEFVPDGNRTNRSQCPSHFAPLSSFRWAADSKWSIRCPSNFWSSIPYQCPAPSQTRGASNAQHSPAIYAIVLILTGTLGMLLALSKFLPRVRREAHSQSSLHADFWNVEIIEEMSEDESKALMISTDGYSSVESSR